LEDGGGAGSSGALAAKRVADGLTPELARALWRLRAETKASDDELVITPADGGRVDASNLMTRVLKPAAVEWPGSASGT
jgi:hypothetical protein